MQDDADRTLFPRQFRLAETAEWKPSCQDNPSSCFLSLFPFSFTAIVTLFPTMYNDDELMDVDGPEFISEVNNQIAAIRSTASNGKLGG